MISLQRRFLYLLKSYFPFVKQRGDILNFRCPYCGDSKRNKYKARGYLLNGTNSYYYYCHNCGISLSFERFLRDNFPFLFSEYTFEKMNWNRKDGIQENEKIECHKKEKEINEKETQDDKIEEINQSLPIHKLILQRCKRLDECSPGYNDVFEYVRRRKIPERFFSLLYASSLLHLIEPLEKYRDAIHFDGHVLVIPFFKYKDDDSFDFFQARVIHNNNSRKNKRYYTFKINESENSVNVFGMDRVNLNEEVFVTEGAIDSFFLHNCVATSGMISVHTIQKIIEMGAKKDQLIVVPDNDYRHNNSTKKNLIRLIENGFRVVIYNKEFRYKDLNESIMNGMKQEELIEYIRRRIFTGLRAKLELASSSD